MGDGCEASAWENLRGVTYINDTITETNYGYTGQENNSGIGWMNYNARWYSPTLGRFTQPDTIVPTGQGVQGLNRYAYVNNNPIRYNDPTGHYIPYDVCEKGEHSIPYCESQYGSIIDAKLKNYNITTGENVTWQFKQNILTAATIEGNKLSSLFEEKGNFLSPTEAFIATHGNVNFQMDENADINGTCITNPNGYNSIVCDSLPTTVTIIHELGHHFDIYIASITGTLPSDNVSSVFYEDDWGYICKEIPCVSHPLSMDKGWEYIEGGEANRRIEDFANMYQNVILGGNPNFPKSGFSSDPENDGFPRLQFMTGGAWYPNYGIYNWVFNP